MEVKKEIPTYDSDAATAPELSAEEAERLKRLKINKALADRGLNGEPTRRLSWDPTTPPQEPVDYGIYEFSLRGNHSD